MTLRLALRSLLVRPVRTAVLAGGFGLGVSVMASLLGIGEVILEQARAPALDGGGDVVVTGASGRVPNARFLLANVLGAPPLAEEVRIAAPASRATLYLLRGERRVAIRARGGIPSLERALNDPETSGIAAWVDTLADAAWAKPAPADVLRAMDRFHPIPDVPARAESWAEWLYFNGRAGTTRFYLTFLVGPATDEGLRRAGVRLQLERDGRRSSYSASADVDPAAVLADAPEISIGSNHVRLDGARYRVRLDLGVEREGEPTARVPGRVQGDITLEATGGRSLPPLTIQGNGGWVSGYTVPVMAGALDGTLVVDGERVSLAGGTGYHDHNWGFWEGVSWRWGQVEHDGLSFVYGRVLPPADAADPNRMPGFVAAIGPDGPLGFATDVSITETPGTGDLPSRIVVRGRGPTVDLTMTLTPESAIVTEMRPGMFGQGLDFLQLRATYQVSGHAGEMDVSFTAPGSAETFRGREAAAQARTP